MNKSLLLAVFLHAFSSSADVVDAPNTISTMETDAFVCIISCSVSLLSMAVVQSRRRMML